MRRVALVLAVMALAILVASGVARAIINGKPDGNRHPYVGALVTDLDGANLPICTGTLISPRVFLTAGHCTDYIRDEGLPTFVSFDPTFDQSSRLVGGRSYVHPRYRQVPGNGLPEFDAYDVGVVVLKRPVTTAKGDGRLPRAGLVERLERGKLLTAVGYGASGFEVGGGQPRPVYRDVRYRATVKLISTENRVADMFVKLSGASAGRGGEGTCFGDSGGPIFMPNQRTVVANNSFVTNFRCAGVTYAQRMDLPPVLRWVRSFPRAA
jgi:trypsin